MQTRVEDRRLPADIDAQPVVQAAAALKPTLRHYQDEIEREQRLPQVPINPQPTATRRVHSREQVGERFQLKSTADNARSSVSTMRSHSERVITRGGDIVIVLP
jgi:hypothetical protein